MTHALETTHLSKQYGSMWALRDCSLTIPAGRVAALVGPNGAGKTTLLHLAVGLLAPTGGDVRIFGHSPQRLPLEVLRRIGFVAQEHPLYHGFTVEETLTLGRKVNARWDDTLARIRLQRLGIPMRKRVGKLSGGQQAQVALAVALAKRPEFLVLDEPVASLDPLARREFLRMLADAVAEDGVTVLLSSHLIGDLERVCDYLALLSASQVQLTGDIEEILRAHAVIIVPHAEVATIRHGYQVVEEHVDRGQATLLVRTDGQRPALAGEVRAATLEEVVLAYLGQPTVSPRQPATTVTQLANTLGEHTEKEGVR